MLKRSISVFGAILFPLLSLISCGGNGNQGGAPNPASTLDPHTTEFQSVVSGSRKSCPKIYGNFQCSNEQGDYSQSLRIKRDNSGRQKLITDKYVWISDGQVHQVVGDDGQTTRYSVDCDSSSLFLNVASSSGDRLSVRIAVVDPSNFKSESKTLISGKLTSSNDSCTKN